MGRKQNHGPEVRRRSSEIRNRLKEAAITPPSSSTDKINHKASRNGPIQRPRSRHATTHMLRIPGPLLLGPQRLLLGPLARGRRAAVAGVRAAMSSAAPRSRRPLRGVVFDMDGTLTVPVIDFPAMYREVLGGDEAYAAARAAGGGAVDILHCIEGWAPDKQRHAYEVIARFEKEGLDRLQIMPGASELCGFLDTKQIRRGLITRNVKDAVDLFHQKFGMTFAPALSREFRPYKPDPAPLLHICSTWNIPPHEVIMVGDSLKDDIVCGKRAGASTCLLDETGRYGPHDSLPEEVKPDFMVSSLTEVFTVLEENFDLAPVPAE